MKAILRDRGNGLYYRGAAEWTRDQEQALDFGDIEPALDSARNSGKPGLELNLLFFGNPEFTVKIALDTYLRPSAFPAPNPPLNARMLQSNFGPA
jgi:hypothetical protein